MPFVFSEKPFQFSICLRMGYSPQDWPYTMLFEVLFETTIPSSIFMDSMSTKLAAMIHYQFPHRMKPPVSIDDLIQNQFAVLSVDTRELATSKDLPGCIIQNNADLDIRSVHFIPIDMSCGQAMLSFIPIPFTSPFLPRLFMGQAFFLKIHVYAVMRDANLVLLSDHSFKHSRSEFIARVCLSNDLSLAFNIGLLGTPNLLAENRLLAGFLKAFPDLLNPSAGDFHLSSNLFRSHPLLLLPNYPVHFLSVQLHIP